MLICTYADMETWKHVDMETCRHVAVQTFIHTYVVYCTRSFEFDATLNYCSNTDYTAQSRYKQIVSCQSAHQTGK